MGGASCLTHILRSSSSVRRRLLGADVVTDELGAGLVGLGTDVEGLTDWAMLSIACAELTVPV